jgi:hypothetical protein
MLIRNHSQRGQATAGVRRFRPGRTLAVVLLAAASAAHSAELDQPSAMAMAGDLLIARPVGVLITALGSVAFVASLPFSAAGGNVGQAAEQLVINPAKTTFVRCLGCTSSGYRKSPREEK